MKYIAREANKSGGQEFLSPDDAIDAAVDWQVETGVTCEIWIRFEDGTERHSILHSLEVQAIAAMTEPLTLVNPYTGKPFL